MKSNYKITNLKNIDNDLVENEMLHSDFIITKRGKVRDAISFFGESKFSGLEVLEINNDIRKSLQDRKAENKTTKVSIDISLIDRKTLADIFSTIAQMATDHEYEIKIIYALAKYTEPSGQVHPNNTVKPVSHFFSGWSNTPGLPVLSIVGLGYEKDKALGAIEFLESSEAFLYVPKSFEERYYSSVLEENSRLLSFFGEKYQFIYHLESPIDAIYSLDSVISANKNKFKIVLLPFGPKIFYASSLLSSFAHPEVSVWSVSGESEDNDSSQDREVTGLLGFSFKIHGNVI